MKVLRTDNKKFFQELKKRHRVSYEHLETIEIQVREIVNAVKSYEKDFLFEQQLHTNKELYPYGAVLALVCLLGEWFL